MRAGAYVSTTRTTEVATKQTEAPPALLDEALLGSGFGRSLNATLWLAGGRFCRATIFLNKTGLPADDVPGGDLAACERGSAAACLPGTGGDAKGERCVPCGAGKYSATVGRMSDASKCTLCKPGKFAQGTARFGAKTSAAGIVLSRGPLAQTAHREIPTQPAAAAESCSPWVQVARLRTNRRVHQQWSDKCIKCPAGTIDHDGTPTECQNCEKGKYRNAAGQQACVDCNPGKYLGTTGGTAAGKCIARMQVARPWTSGMSPPATERARYCVPQARSITTETPPACQNCPAGKYQAREAGVHRLQRGEVQHQSRGQQRTRA